MYVRTYVGVELMCTESDLTYVRTYMHAYWYVVENIWSLKGESPHLE